MNSYYTIKSILRRAIAELSCIGIESAELDARVLLETAIRHDSTFIFTHPEAPVTNAAYQRFRRMIRRRKRGEPIAYILGHKEFYGLDFTVNKHVLIPRPETEWLVETSIKYLVSRIKEKETKCSKPLIPNTKYQILDLGTGSGNIIISIANQLTGLHADWLTFLYATDISDAALKVAKKNATIHNDKDQIKFFQSDLFSNPRLPKQFDLIIANLPYVPKKVQSKKLKVKSEIQCHPELDPEPSAIGLTPKDGIDFEPQAAIFADDGGATIIKNFLAQSKSRIKPGGQILIELDPRNAVDIEQAARHHFPTASIELTKDLAGLDRYLTVKT